MAFAGGDELSQLMASYYKEDVSAKPNRSQRSSADEGDEYDNAKSTSKSSSSTVSSGASTKPGSSASISESISSSKRKRTTQDDRSAPNGKIKKYVKGNAKSIHLHENTDIARPADADDDIDGHDDSIYNLDRDDRSIDDDQDQSIVLEPSFPAKEVWVKSELRKIHFRLEKALVARLSSKDLSRLPLQTKATLRNGDAMWHRWLFCALESSEKPCGPIPDQLGIRGAEPVLQNELDGIEGHLPAIAEFSAAASRLVASSKPPEANSKQGRKQHVTLTKINHREMKLRYRSDEVTVTLAHLKKLAQSFQIARRNSPAQNSMSSSTSQDPDYSTEFADQTFLRASFCVLMRYESFGASGFQAALPDPVFDFLHHKFGVEEECFASPLNRYKQFSRYCSAFPDTDNIFGSRGSFFQFWPRRGSFEVNPPFTTSTVLLTADHIGQLLTDATGACEPLSFVVIVPSRYDPFFEGSAFHRKMLQVPNRTHTYKQGAQHRAKSRSSVASTTDTTIHFLQTDEGVKKWGVTEKACQELCAAFQSLPKIK